MPRGGWNKGLSMSTKGNGPALQWLTAHMEFDGPDCLIWPFSKRWNGYGQIGLGNGKMGYPHRVMCERVNGPAPTPKHVAAHSCHNGGGGCVHPKHLSWISPSENLLQRREAGTLTTKRWNKYGVLPAVDVQRIEKLKGKLNQREIADLFGISYQHVSVIHNRKLVKQQT